MDSYGIYRAPAAPRGVIRQIDAVDRRVAAMPTWSGESLPADAGDDAVAERDLAPSKVLGGVAPERFGDDRLDLRLLGRRAAEAVHGRCIQLMVCTCSAISQPAGWRSKRER